MKNLFDFIINQVFSVAGFTAIAGVAYLFGYHRTKRPYYDFIFSYSTGTYNSTTDEYDWKIGGIIKNRSTNENSIVSVHRIVWKNKKKNSYLSDSLANMSFKDRNTNSIQYLPLYFQKKQAINLEVETKFQVKGTSEEAILREREEIAPHIFLPKYKYELCFEDIDGNYFDQFGKLINKKEADIWWTLPNTFRSIEDWNLIPLIRHSMLIFLSKIVFMLKKIFWNLGI